MPQKSIQGEDSREPGASIPTLESSDTVGTGKHKIQEVGASRIWGSVKDSTVKSVKSVISKIDGGLRVHVRPKITL